ncbi:MAG: ATP-dependent helicase [Actinomycetia bacterium]|nr:ATP-dependent helicase [Actinomycetes bacterium]
MSAPQLVGDALAAVLHRGSHLQIIASAGSGKTEVVAQRVAHLLSVGEPASGIVAFTFTERAAAELRHRIAQRASEIVGPEILDQFGAMFVGTIHSYCFQLLQTHVARYETYDVLDDKQLTALLTREGHRLDIRQFDGNKRLFGSIARFLQAVDVVENELLDPESMPDPFRQVLLGYLATLDRYRLLTFGQQTVRAVQALQDPGVLGKVRSSLRHLIVDEYQDVNPAQERLIARLAGPGVELCVVGDDDQAIYQWRGSDVGNIVTFANRYEGVETFEIVTNRRSRPTIIEMANSFATTIPNRLDKAMGTDRPPGGAPEVVVWEADTEQAEAGWIADKVLDLHETGVAFRDIAVLVRTRAAYGAIVDAFNTFGIPLQPGGRTGLFDQPQARVIGQTFAWMTGVEWRGAHQRGSAVQEATLLDDYQRLFELDDAARSRLRRFLHAWRDAVPAKDRKADLVGEFYELLDEIGVRSWDLNDSLLLNRVGTMARFTQLLADYESVRRRARPDSSIEGEQVGGEDRGDWYYRNLAIHIVNYAQGAYEDFDGEDDIDLDAVDLTTVHRAKGLEWPVAFIPSVTNKRFPTSRSGELRDWLVPRDLFPAARYEGSDADERRLFYVAVTRARDWLSVSRHERVVKQRVPASPYWTELGAHATTPEAIRLPDIESRGTDQDTIELSFSELASFLDCPTAFRLRNLVGFQPRLAPELGYGKAVHHVLRTVAEQTKSSGSIPGAEQIDRILDTSFFLPTASKPVHRQLKDAARRLITEYAISHEADLHRIWETERPFELHLDGVTVSGRADVILDHEGGVPTSLAILDYKTSTSDPAEHALQLQVYADAGRREGLDVTAAFVHDLKAGRRFDVDVTDPTVVDAEATILEAADRLRSRAYEPAPGVRCRRCEVRTVCASAVR